MQLRVDRLRELAAVIESVESDPDLAVGLGKPASGFQAWRRS